MTGTGCKKMEVEEHEIGGNRTVRIGFGDLPSVLTCITRGPGQQGRLGSASSQEEGSEWIGRICFYIKPDIIVILTGNVSPSEWN